MGDLEKANEFYPDPKVTKAKVETEEVSSNDGSSTTFQRLTNAFVRISGIETRGIEPVPVDERQPSTPDNYVGVFLLWLSSSLTANNIIVGLYGPSFYNLDWTQSVICAVSGAILGSMATGYMSTWGPRSGHRTLVVTRYFLGYYPSKFFYVLNALTMLGYAMVNDILGGQIIFTVSGNHIGVSVGIIIVSVLTWFIATVGMHVFNLYTRYAWILQLSILSIMIGCAGPSFNTTTLPKDSSHSPPTASQRLSFFSLCVASAVTWAPSSADYFVYLPTSTKPWRMFLASSAGMSLALILTTLLGIGLATGVTTNGTWFDASVTSQGSLLTVSFSTLNGFGRFCAVMLLLSAVSNNIPCTYSAGLNLQMILGRYGPRVPRPLLTTLEVIVYTVCAIVARNYLREIFESFLPLMSYWIAVWLAVCLEEACLFRRRAVYDWSAWNMPHKLPMGLAAGMSIVVGCVGAVVGMSQSYFVGPVPRTLAVPADMGMWLAFCFAALVYPPLRVVELRVVGR
ncbi:putative purine-cytosine permease [Aspergillus ambiguus]|uniref:purine-cytosine permease family protein n=1 Tax=Aspergillus ambiguus TaxID=176160 RepID=UPI003CCE0974